MVLVGVQSGNYKSGPNVSRKLLRDGKKVLEELSTRHLSNLDLTKIVAVEPGKPRLAYVRRKNVRTLQKKSNQIKPHKRRHLPIA